MLLRFTTTDMLNASLVDVHTGNVAYKILTSRQSDPTSSSSSVSSDFVPEKKSHLPSSPSSPSASEALRRTYITSGVDGKTLVDISWNGRRPDITIGDEKIGGLSDLFETSAAEIMPKVLSLTSRFDPELVWTATPESLTLVDSHSELTKGTFHQTVVRVPSPSKSNPSSCTFLHTRIPGVGHHYLEFDETLPAVNVEIIVSFLMMEILRRGCFAGDVSPYMFERDRVKLWHLREATETVVRRFRRSTL